MASRKPRPLKKWQLNMLPKSENSNLRVHIISRGYCLGGTIAYEVARHLRDQGQEIGVLALLDTHANWAQESVRDSLIHAYQRVAFHLKNAWMYCRSGISSFVAEKLREGSRRLVRRWKVLSSHISYQFGWREN